MAFALLPSRFVTKPAWPCSSKAATAKPLLSARGRPPHRHVVTASHSQSNTHEHTLSSIYHVTDFPVSKTDNITTCSSLACNEVASVGVVTASAQFNQFCRKNWPLFAAVEVVALVGAAYTGYLAHKRKEELEEMNARLRTINAKLRHQTAEIEESMHDPIRDAKRQLRAGKAEAAVVLFEEGVTQATDDPSLISARKGLARAHLALLNTDKAIEQLELALTHDLEDNQSELEDIYGLLGDCYTDKGDLEKAMHFYDKCVALD